MILIGALGSIPAATTGMFAARQAMRVSDDATLSQLKQKAAFTAEQWELLRHHIQLNGSAAVLLGVLVITWLGASDQLRRSAHLAYLLALLIAVGLISAGAWHGGEMVYTNDIGTPGEGGLAETGGCGKGIDDALHRAGGERQMGVRCAANQRSTDSQG